VMNIDGKTVYLGRYIMNLTEEDKELRVIHKDGIKENFKKSNLKVVTHKEVKRERSKTINVCRRLKRRR